MSEFDKICHNMTVIVIDDYDFSGQETLGYFERLNQLGKTTVLDLFERITGD